MVAFAYGAGYDQRNRRRTDGLEYFRGRVLPAVKRVDIFPEVVP